MEETRYRRTAIVALALSVLPFPVVIAGMVAIDFARIDEGLLFALALPILFLSCVPAVLLGHFVLYRRPVPVESTQETRWAMSAIMIGYFCLIPALCALPFIVALIELPWIIFRSLGRNLRTTVIAAVALALVANLCHAIGGTLISVGLVGTLELALFAGSMPFARRSGLDGRHRMILSILFYGLTIGSVVWGYVVWAWGPRFRW